MTLHSRVARCLGWSTPYISPAMHATTHKHSPSSATPVTPLPAGAESADALGGFSPPPRVPQGGSENRGSGGLPRLRGGSGWPLQGGPRGLRPRPATPENPPRPPASGGPKIGEISDFLPPSGAKSWGSGGAPPTNLILLRNQRQLRSRPRTARRPPARPAPAPPGPPPSPPEPHGGWWCGVVGGGGWSVCSDWVLRRLAEAVNLAPSAGRAQLRLR